MAPQPKEKVRNSGGKRKRKHFDESSSSHSSDDDGTGLVKDILIEATIRASDGGPATPMYLTIWEGYLRIDCSWVKQSGMSPVAAKWWNLERERRYPGYQQAYLPCYDAKSNSLSLSESTSRWLSWMTPPRLIESGVPLNVDELLTFITTPAFDIKRFLNFLLNLQNVLDRAKANMPADNLNNSDNKSEEKSLPQQVTPPRRRRPRLIVSSSSDDESDCG